MTCPAATGPCTTPVTGACGPIKILDPDFPALTGLVVSGLITHFTVEWDTGTSYPDQNVRVYFRDAVTGATTETVVVPRDDGIISSGAFAYANDTEIWIRPEDSVNAGPWQKTVLDVGSLDFSDPSNSYYVGVAL